MKTYWVWVGKRLYKMHVSAYGTISYEGNGAWIVKQRTKVPLKLNQ